MAEGQGFRGVVVIGFMFVGVQRFMSRGAEVSRCYKPKYCVNR